jgi:hypothetical protein
LIRPEGYKLCPTACSFDLILLLMEVLMDFSRRTVVHILMILTLFGLNLTFTDDQVRADSASCEQIRAACKDAGFVLGGGARDGLLLDCFNPIVIRFAPEGRRVGLARGSHRRPGQRSGAVRSFCRRPGRLSTTGYGGQLGTSRNRTGAGGVAIDAQLDRLASVVRDLRSHRCFDPG